MSTSHTPTPWVGVDPKTGRFRNTHWDAVNERVSSSMSAPIKSGRETVALVVMAGWENKEKLHANARRIVACVNACEGISTESLEENKPVARLAHQFNKSVKQLDVLMKALLTISEESTDYEAREHALAAIAKVTGEQA